jgi:glycosyltransferase involved in cell wall biosynthesis
MTLDHAALDTRLVSVIIPAYNASDTIVETLESVRAQSHRALDVIIVDDGSQDATVEIAQQFATQDPRFRVIRQANAGVAAARNHGAAEATSDLLAFVDADDLWTTDKIERQLAALDAAGPETGLCYTWYAMIDGASKIIYRENVRPISGRVLDTLFVNNFVGNGSSALVTRQAFNAAGGFEPALRNAGAQGCEDILFYCRVAEHYAFAVVPDYLVGYRQLPDNMSSNLARMLKSWLMVVDEMAGRHPDKSALLREGVRRYVVWLTRRAVHRRRPAALLAVLARLAPRRPMLAMKMALIEAPRTMLEPLRRPAQASPPVAAPVPTPPADDRFALGRQYLI